MQTKQQVQELLACAGVEPNKRLGQNFLIDLNLMRLLIETADIHDNDVVLEVGSATGSLTEAIAENAGKVIAVEVDSTLAEIAKQRLAGKENVEVVNADILEKKSMIDSTVTRKIASAREKNNGRFLLVANLPYSVGCPVMLNLVTGRIKADAMFVTVQREVAERMTAKPGDGHYGILSIILEAAGEIKTIKTLSPGVFWPQPAVASAMVTFVRDQAKACRIKDIELFCDCVNLFMGHRRKQLKGCIKVSKGRLAEIKGWQTIFEQAGISAHARPEELTPEDYLAITNILSKKRPL